MLCFQFQCFFCSTHTPHAQSRDAFLTGSFDRCLSLACVMSHPALAFGLGHLGTGRCVTAAKSRLPSRSHGFVAVRAQGDAATSGNRAAGEASPSTGTAKGPREGQKRGGQQVKGKPQARPTSEQDIRSTAPFPTRPNKPQAKKQPPPSALSQIQTSPFGKDPPGESCCHRAMSHECLRRSGRGRVQANIQLSTHALATRRSQERLRCHCGQAERWEEHFAQRHHR